MNTTDNCGRPIHISHAVQSLVDICLFIADYLEDPTVTEDQLQKMQKAEYEMRNSI